VRFTTAEATLRSLTTFFRGFPARVASPKICSKITTRKRVSRSAAVPC
jgi:hypothetical protein